MQKAELLKLLGVPKNRVCLALDGVTSLEEVAQLVALLSPYVGWFKSGYETILGFGAGPMVKVIKENEGKTFLDPKIHDIPQTMVNAAKNINKLGVEMFNIHCSSGRFAIASVRQASPDTILLGVTALTSLDDTATQSIYGKSVEETVKSFALNAADCGLDGIVCSGKDLEFLSKDKNYNDLIKVTPGIQLPSTNPNDQSRVATPYGAIKAGASILVIGRAILEAPDKVEAAKVILADVEKAMKELEAELA